MINKLTDLAIRSFIRARRTGQASKKKLSDGGGLYLVVTPAGTAVWRVKYRFGGKEGLFAAGTYPATTLEAARAEREKVKTLLREGCDEGRFHEVGCTEQDLDMRALIFDACLRHLSRMTAPRI